MSLFLRRRFYEFKLGHSNLVLILSSINFTLIVYRLLVEEVDFLTVLFPSLTSFVVFIFLLYPPIAILVGRFYWKHQLWTDQSIQTQVHPGFLQITEQLDRIERKLDAHA